MSKIYVIEYWKCAKSLEINNLERFFQKSLNEHKLHCNALKQKSLGHKKWQATHIAPLQPFTLATFRSWGSSTGAGRMRLAAAKLLSICYSNKAYS